MKNFVIACLIGATLAMYVTMTKATGLALQTTAECEKERAFNVRRDRRLNYIQVPKQINMEAVSLAIEILGTRPSVTAALLYCENGPEFLESGSIDKTPFFSKYVPIKNRSALEGARCLNRMAWEWFVTTPEGKRAFDDFLFYAAKPYTHLGGPEQNAWAINMATAIERFEGEIKVSGESAHPVAVIMRTPTPDYGFQNNSGKAKRPAKKARKRRTT